MSTTRSTSPDNRISIAASPIALRGCATEVSLGRSSDASAFHLPELVAFGVSYGYRMLPIMVEEFHTVFDGFRLRMAPPERPGLLGWRTLVHRGRWRS